MDNAEAGKACGDGRQNPIHKERQGRAAPQGQSPSIEEQLAAAP